MFGQLEDDAIEQDSRKAPDFQQAPTEARCQLPIDCVEEMNCKTGALLPK